LFEGSSLPINKVICWFEKRSYENIGKRTLKFEQFSKWFESGDSFSTLINPNPGLILVIIPSYNPSNMALKNNIMQVDTWGQMGWLFDS